MAVTISPVLAAGLNADRVRGALTTITVGLALALAGCGGGGDDAPDESTAPDSAALSEAFDAGAEQAYTDADKSRADDFGSGVVIDDCFAIDDDGAAAIGDAAGFELTLGENNFLQGVPGEEERIGCSVEAGDDGPPPIFMVTVGTTLVDTAQFLERIKRNLEDVTEIDGEAPGLDPESVIGVEGDGTRQFAWIEDDFLIGVGGPADQLSEEEGFAALSAAVEGVESTLGG